MASGNSRQVTCMRKLEWMLNRWISFHYRRAWQCICCFVFWLSIFCPSSLSSPLHLHFFSVVAPFNSSSPAEWKMSKQLVEWLMLLHSTRSKSYALTIKQPFQSNNARRQVINLKVNAICQQWPLLQINWCQKIFILFQFIAHFWLTLMLSMSTVEWHSSSTQLNVRWHFATAINFKS